MHKLFAFFSLLLLLGNSSCTNSEIRGAYLGQTPPGHAPEIFAPGLISGPWYERDLAISPQGDEIFYTLVSPKNRYHVIVEMKLVDSVWSAPEVAPFSGQYSDLEPAFSPDGNRLFFASKRPLSGDGTPKDWDIWYVDRTEAGWSEARNPGPPVNTDADEFYPSVTQGGTLYFTTTRKESKGAEDLFRSTSTENGYNAPENLGDSINTKSYEFNAFIAPDESYLIFSSFGRKDGQGGGDLYISNRKDDGNWTRAQNLGPEINSEALDYCPFVSPDGAYFFFTSEKTDSAAFGRPTRNYEEVIELFQSPKNGNSNLYWMRFEKILEGR